MIRTDAVKKAEEIRVPSRYSISLDQTKALIENYTGRYELSLASFRLGYLQGRKAAKAEMKRKEAAPCKK